MFTLELDDNQKIVLFEILNKIESGSFSLDASEQGLISELVATFEKNLTEVFSEDYSSLVEEAKKQLLENQN